MAMDISELAVNPFSGMMGSVGGGGVTPPKSSSLEGLLSIKGMKAALPGLLAYLAAQKGAGLFNEYKNQQLMREAAGVRTGMTSPESIYERAALPQAQQEALMARQALISELTGGVLGPSLARGETLI